AKDPAAARNFSATLLHNGQVLTSGGENGTYPAKETITTAATLFDPATAASTDTGSMTIPREFHTLTVLPNGQVPAADGETQKRWEGSASPPAPNSTYLNRTVRAADATRTGPCGRYAGSGRSENKSWLGEPLGRRTRATGKRATYLTQGSEGKWGN